MKSHCARCGRPAVGGWVLHGWTVCDRIGCVRSASHGLLRGALPDALVELDPDGLERVAKFDRRMESTRPAPPPWKRPGYVDTRRR